MNAVDANFRTAGMRAARNEMRAAADEYIAAMDALRASLVEYLEWDIRDADRAIVVAMHDVPHEHEHNVRRHRAKAAHEDAVEAVRAAENRWRVAIRGIRSAVAGSTFGESAP